MLTSPLRLSPQTSFNLINIPVKHCHAKSSSVTYNSLHTALLALILCASAIAQTPPSSNLTNAGPQLPPHTSLIHGEWVQQADLESHEGPVNILKGHAHMESSRMLLEADEIEYNEDTNVLIAHGNVYFHSFEKNEQLWCDHMEYNTEEQTGRFWDVRGETTARTVVKRGVLSGNSPYHWEGQWAERVAGDKYYLYNGWLTNCKMPNPWWKMRGPKFEIVYHDYAKAYKSWFVLRRIPLFYTPYFYHSLKRQPRHSGLLLPTIVPHSERGFMMGAGYYWAINRSYDLTYRVWDYFQGNALANHVDFRGKPSARADFDLIVYDVKDGGIPGQGGGALSKFGGLNVDFLGRADLGNGWKAIASVDYVSSFRFVQYWSQSVNEVIGSEIHSIGFANKDWSTYSVDVVLSRLENFQTPELVVPGTTELVRNAVLLHKLPEVDLASRDRRIWKDIPLWFSFYSSAGMLYRSEPIFNSNNVEVLNFQTKQFTSRVDFSPHLTSAFHFGDFSFVPSIGLDETFYGQSQAATGQVLSGTPLYQVQQTNLVRSARDFSLDILLPSFGRVFDKKTIFGDKLKHVIEPRVSYHYMTGIGDDFTRFIRFDETDLLSNTNTMTYSLTNRIYAKHGDDVNEIFTWELAQQRYFNPTFGGAVVPGQANVFATTAELTAYPFVLGPRGASPIASVLRASPIPGLGINWQADYDPLDPLYHGIVNSYFSVDYHYKKYFLSVGNNSVHADPLLTAAANQYHGRIGFGDPQHRGWNAGMDITYDYKLGRLDYAISQVTYNTDCCGFSVQFRRINFGLRDENLYEFAFALANLGSVGSLKKNDRMF